MERAEYLTELLAEDEVLREVRARIEEQGMPSISIAPMYGRLLTLLVATSRSEDLLEIGLLGGYSAICMVRGLGASGGLTSLELREDYAEIAAGHLQKAGLRDRVSIRVGAAKASLAELARDGRRFDFIFIDADKESYPTYLEAALSLARHGTLIVADNALYRDRVTDPQDGTAAVRSLRDFNRALMSDPRLTAVILPAYDGLAIARVTAG